MAQEYHWRRSSLQKSITMQDYNLERLSWPKSIIGKHRLLIGPPVASAGIRSEINPPRPCALRRVDALTKFQTVRALKLLNCFRFVHPASAYPQQPRGPACQKSGLFLVPHFRPSRPSANNRWSFWSRAH